jgi:hypothetical protein
MRSWHFALVDCLRDVVLVHAAHELHARVSGFRQRLHVLLQPVPLQPAVHHGVGIAGWHCSGGLDELI